MNNQTTNDMTETQDPSGSGLGGLHCSAWIPMTEKSPTIGQTVITYHKLNRVEMMIYTNSGFRFPITCPLNSKGEPLGWVSGYGGEVITHWMPLPPPPNNQITNPSPK